VLDAGLISHYRSHEPTSEMSCNTSMHTLLSACVRYAGNNAACHRGLISPVAMKAGTTANHNTVRIWSAIRSISTIASSGPTKAPNLIGVRQKDLTKRVTKLVPDYCIGFVSLTKPESSRCSKPKQAG
jgi:hypothetical protein